MDQIIQAKQGSQADMLSLLQQFQPILKKYGRKLWGEDGLEDMTAAFLQVIHDMKPEQIRCRAEGAVVQYLVQSVRHAYERLQRERMRQPAIAFSLNEMEEQDSLPALAKEDSAEKQRFSDLVKGCPRLTEKETYVLEQVYYWGYTAAELAPGMGTSKQNVAAGLRKTPAAVGNRGISKQPLRGEAAYFTMEFVRDLE